MCGIVGICSCSDEDLRGTLERMAATIVHRGPDDDGFHYDRGAAIGMRRLSIIDLSGGHQPLSDESGERWIVFNGEIYNFQSVRPPLEDAGHVFRTHSDTETIVHAFEQYGPDCVHHLNGMFGFAIWDSRERKLFIARDRMGVKPLYYAWDGRRLVFGSEIKAILASGFVERELDDEALWHYLTFGYVPAPLTMWRNVRKLPPGHRLMFEPATAALCVERYWDMPYGKPGPALSADDEVRQFTDLFLDSVRLRLIADVPVGIFLSGGLDSSAVAAAVNEVHNTPLKTFSIAFHEGGRYDETPFARKVAEKLGTDHHEIRIGRQEYMDFLPELVYYTDEPLADRACIPLYYVSRLAAQHVKVVLSGEGADEVLAGYDFENVVAGWERRQRFLRVPTLLRSTLPAAAFHAAGRRDLVDRIHRRNLPLPDHNIATAPYMTRFFSSAEKRELWPNAPVNPRDSDDLVRDYYRRAPTRDPLNQTLYAYCQDWLVEDLLMKADKMTMANSIELRVPFLDYRLVEWLASRPSTAKVQRDASGKLVTKYLLRRFAESRVPPEVLQRSKEGFPNPVRDWVAGSFGEEMGHALKKPSSWVGSRFNPTAVDRIIADRHRSAQHGDRLWILYLLELWAQRWL